MCIDSSPVFSQQAHSCELLYKSASHACSQCSSYKKARARSIPAIAAQLAVLRAAVSALQGACQSSAAPGGEQLAGRDCAPAWLQGCFNTALLAMCTNHCHASYVCIICPDHILQWSQMRCRWQCGVANLHQHCYTHLCCPVDCA